MRKRQYRRASLPGWLILFLEVSRREPARAAAAAYWYLTRRRVRAGNRLREGAARLPEAYRIWIGTVEQREVQDLKAADQLAPGGPTFSIFVYAPSWANRATLDDTLDSIRAQIGGHGNLIVIGPASLAGQVDPKEHFTSDAGIDVAIRSALAAAPGDFVIFVPPDAILPRWALASYRAAVREYPAAAILFGDEDRIDDKGRRSQPWFKPQWNAELILAQDYVSKACAITAPLARSAVTMVGDLAQNPGYSVLLAASSQPRVQVRHVGQILCHMRVRMGQYDPAANRQVVSRHVAPMKATVETGPFGTIRVHWPLPDAPPSVTIIIPTRDRVELLEACVGSLLRETDYPDYDVVIVDNGSVEPRTHSWFEAMASHDRISVRRYDHPYNYSAINNFAAKHARGDYLCLLNNDTEIIEANWLRELMRYAIRPEVGAVGAKLLYPDRSIQHAGVVIGLGNAAGHAHRALPNDEAGYFGMAHCAHYASAVTAACLVVEARKFARVGGLDDADLQIAYNDVDLCLKLARAGLHNVYAPQAVLIHHESKSRGLDLSPRHIERYRRELAVLQQRWGTETVVDPMHHFRLDRASETYCIRL